MEVTNESRNLMSGGNGMVNLLCVLRILGKTI